MSINPRPTIYSGLDAKKASTTSLVFEMAVVNTHQDCRRSPLHCEPDQQAANTQVRADISPCDNGQLDHEIAETMINRKRLKPHIGAEGVQHKSTLSSVQP